MDVNPGDRAAACGGMMEPIALEGTAARFRIVHRCVRCKLDRKNDVVSEDDKDALVGVAERRQMRNN